MSNANTSKTSRDTGSLRSTCTRIIAIEPAITPGSANRKTVLKWNLCHGTSVSRLPIKDTHTTLALYDNESERTHC